MFRHATVLFVFNTLIVCHLIYMTIKVSFQLLYHNLISHSFPLTFIVVIITLHIRNFTSGCSGVTEDDIALKIAAQLTMSVKRG